MKKILLMSILFCSAINVLAQDEEKTINPTDKGHFIVDGSVYFSTNHSKSRESGFESKNKSFGFGISPKAAYFVIDRLAVGLETSFNYTENESTNSDNNKYTSNSKSVFVGPFFRYYLSNGLFGQASFGFGTSKSNSDGFKSSTDVFRYKLGLGYAIFLNQHTSIEPLISYQHNKNSSNESTFESTNNGFIFGVGFTIYL
ncbi:outer membrane beta-barrel protein [Psychroserpens ponticola]|uniref:Outer membrane beta-barrel protein n=1 Tax=Psychroserpens ponticola TaxID=2932268 RepID=A0ABY7RSZ2_9FLAO|nr:outer membrane beta-barrel protein [Psychroserpens ponticola]WCO00234.1 outer membrane beta-barrel protein [Psychroserpens ponticola]